MENVKFGIAAFLEVWEYSNGNRTHIDLIPIGTDDDFYIGRNPKICRFFLSESTVSNKHLRINSIRFEDGSNVPPLVYAKDLSTNGTLLKRTVTNDHSFESSYTCLMTQKSPAVLLNDSDELCISPFLSLVFSSQVQELTSPVTEDTRQEQEKRAISDRYIITNRLLGWGGQGNVYVAIHRKTSRQLACKVIDISHFADTRAYEYHLQRRLREVDILKNLNHPNIVHLEKVFWNSRTIYAFQELITGGDLFSYIQHKGCDLSDVEAALLLQQILKGVKYLHDHSIVHRDLKPDNILLTSVNDGARIVITDFGAARYVPRTVTNQTQYQISKQRMYSIVGTPEYTAPEVHGKNCTVSHHLGYSKAVDMWSIGCIASALLTGDVIFANRSDANSAKDPTKIILFTASRYNLSVLDRDPAWLNVGARPKDFVRKLLVLDETKRMTADQALAHDWFSNQWHAADYEAAYQRALKDWYPRRVNFRIVEKLEEVTPQPLIRNDMRDRLFQDLDI